MFLKFRVAGWNHFTPAHKYTPAVRNLNISKYRIKCHLLCQKNLSWFYQLLFKTGCYFYIFVLFIIMSNKTNHFSMTYHRQGSFLLYSFNVTKNDFVDIFDWRIFLVLVLPQTIIFYPKKKKCFIKSTYKSYIVSLNCTKVTKTLQKVLLLVDIMFN